MTQARYEDRATCEKDLDAEKSLFLKNTGLQPVAFYCFTESEKHAKNHHTWVSRIDGFGTARLKPFVFDGIFFGTPNIAPTVLQSSITHSLSIMSGIESSRAVIDLSTSPASIAAAYYGSTERAFVLNEFANFDTLGSCEREQASIDGLLKEFAVQGLSSFCTLNSVTLQTRYYFFGIAMGAYSVYRVQKSFPDHNQCKAAITSVVDRYKSAKGSPHVKGFCSFENTEFIGRPAYFVKLIIGQPGGPS